jgi:hypothetical protein
MSDPYASVVMPTYSGCADGTNKSYGTGTWTLSPGVYCNGVSFTNAAIVTMNPGVYFLNQGSFNVGGAVQLTGTGVTIVLTSSTGSNYATFTIGNGATVTLSAPTSGATAGIVFFGDRNAPIATTSTSTHRDDHLSERGQQPIGLHPAHRGRGPTHGWIAISEQLSHRRCRDRRHEQHPRRVRMRPEAAHS